MKLDASLLAKGARIFHCESGRGDGVCPEPSKTQLSIVLEIWVLLTVLDQCGGSSCSLEYLPKWMMLFLFLW